MKIISTFILLLLLSTGVFATKYYTRADGGWSNLGPDSTDCSCTPDLLQDSVFIYHTYISSDNNLTYSQSSYLYIGNGGLIDITAGGQPSRTINGKVVVAGGGKIQTNNNLTFTIGITGNVTVETGGEIEYANNVNFINNGTFILYGTVTGSQNTTITFSGGSTVEINGDLFADNVINETDITGTGKIVYSGSFTNTNGTLNGCANCVEDNPIELARKAPSGDLSNLTIYEDGTWDNGTPTASLHALVRESVAFGINLVSNTLTVAPGRIIAINTGYSYTVQDSINNLGTIILENGASLIQTGTGNNNDGSGEYIIKKEGTQDELKYNMWASPVPAKSITEAFPLANLYDVFIFDASIQNWKYDFGSLNPENETGTPYSFSSSDLISGADGIMNPGVGYFVPGNNTSVTREFNSQAVHNGVQTVNVFAPGINSTKWTLTDWNLLGNPYPSNISASDFLNHNNTTLTNAVHLWLNDSSSYESFNNTDSKMLTSCQAFWVQANSSTTVEFTNAMRVHSASSVFRSGGSVSIGEAYLSLKSSNSVDKTRLYLSPQADDGLDNLFDASKMRNPNGINFYTLIDSGQFVFQSVTPPSAVEDKTIPLAVEYPSNTTLAISADSITSNSPYRFFLHDKKLSKRTELKKSVEVEFDYESGSDQYRFELVVKLKENDNRPEAADGGLNPQVISSTGRFELLNTTPEHINRVNVYDLRGRELTQLRNIEPGSLEPSPALKNGVYIVSFEYENGRVEAQKILVR